LPACKYGLLYAFRAAAPVPDLVGQVRVAHRALAGRAVAGGAGVAEDRAAQGHRLRILRQHVDGLAGVRLEGLLQARVLHRLLLGVLLLGAPAAVAGDAAQAAVPEEVADAEDDGDVEQVDPPPRKRLVVLGD